MRRLRYGLNVVAMERDNVPPEGPFDVALTNGLAAIVALDHPGSEKDAKGRVLAASALLTFLEGEGVHLEYAALREALIEITQPLRHARADDEFLLPTKRHLDAWLPLTHIQHFRSLSWPGSMTRSTPWLRGYSPTQQVRPPASICYLRRSGA